MRRSQAGPTIEDVAQLAQVSVATVSRALRGLPNVAPSTRERVLEAASELRYVADPSASRLASGRSLTVGLVVPMLDQWFYARMFSGVEAITAAAGYDVLPITTSGPRGAARLLGQLPLRKRVDGLIVVDVELTAEQLGEATRDRVHVVTVGLTIAGASAIVIENAAAARLAVGHLTGLGHRRVAMIGGVDDDPFHFSVPVDRRRGYLEGLRAAGIDADDTLCVPGNFSLAGGAEAMQRLLHLDEPPTAVFALSDEMAIGAMQAARDAGLRVPEDLSIVGFDDHDVSEYLGLTTVRQDVVGMGERAATRLLEGIVGAGTPTREVFPTRLLVRRSTGPPPARRVTGRGDTS